jgi:hypothetical protein
MCKYLIRKWKISSINLSLILHNMKDDNLFFLLVTQINVIITPIFSIFKSIIFHFMKHQSNRVNDILFRLTSFQFT